MEIATLTITIAQDGDEAKIHFTQGWEDAESNPAQSIQEIMKIVQNALGMSEKPPIMKPSEG